MLLFNIYAIYISTLNWFPLNLTNTKKQTCPLELDLYLNVLLLWEYTPPGNYYQCIQKLYENKIVIFWFKPIMLVNYFSLNKNMEYFKT